MNNAFYVMSVLFGVVNLVSLLRFVLLLWQERRFRAFHGESKDNHEGWKYWCRRLGAFGTFTMLLYSLDPYSAFGIWLYPQAFFLSAVADWALYTSCMTIVWFISSALAKILAVKPSRFLRYGSIVLSGTTLLMVGVTRALMVINQKWTVAVFVVWITAVQLTFGLAWFFTLRELSRLVREHQERMTKQAAAENPPAVEDSHLLQRLGAFRKFTRVFLTVALLAGLGQAFGTSTIVNTDPLFSTDPNVFDPSNPNLALLLSISCMFGLLAFYSGDKRHRRVGALGGAGGVGASGPITVLVQRSVVQANGVPSPSERDLNAKHTNKRASLPSHSMHHSNPSTPTGSGIGSQHDLAPTTTTPKNARVQREDRDRRPSTRAQPQYAIATSSTAPTATSASQVSS